MFAREWTRVKPVPPCVPLCLAWVSYTLRERGGTTKGNRVQQQVTRESKMVQEQGNQSRVSPRETKTPLGTLPLTPSPTACKTRAKVCELCIADAPDIRRFIDKTED